jgi:hypothetical protein
LVDAHFRCCLIRSTLVDEFEIAFAKHGNYVAVALYFGGSKAYAIKQILQREPRIGKTWFPAGSILPNEESLDAAVSFANCSRKVDLL